MVCCITNPVPRTKSWCVIALVLVTPVTAAPLSPGDLAACIDRHLSKELAAVRAKASGGINDAGFARRVFLDLVGRIPTVAEIRMFLEDTTPNRRAALVGRLMESGAYSRHAATFWRREMVPQTDTPQFAALAVEIELWLAVQIRDGVPYDRIARSLLKASRRASPRSAPNTFLAASEFKPENLAANATRAFLGVNLDCAQCHDHPFARWTRNQFWETAAFFTAPPPTRDGAVGLELTIPNTTRKVRPKLLIGAGPKWPDALQADTARRLFAD